MFSEQQRTQLKNIINDIDISKADIWFAWKLAHEPLIRSLLTNMPFEAVLGIDAVTERHKAEENAQVFKASMLLALIFVGKEDETGKQIGPPIGIGVEDFMRTCKQEEDEQHQSK